jgi:hypothetical protein
MTPLLFAAALALSGSPSAQPPGPALSGEIPPALQKRLDAASACSRLSNQTVAPDGVRLFKRLDQLPKGVLEHAVWRTVGGCPVREIVFEGQTYYVVSGNAQVQRLQPADPAPLQRQDRSAPH